MDPLLPAQPPVADRVIAVPPAGAPSVRSTRPDDETLTLLTAECERLLAERGMHAALQFLNGRTRHRFTGVYRSDPPVLRSIALFDRENPTLHLSGDINPLRETYCSITAGTGEPFATPDAARDHRLTEHPARGTVLSYCGVPLLLDDGRPYGTLCHFDLRPRIVPAGEVPLLVRVAPLIFRAVAAGRPDP